ncbi:MAG: hypothetical protein LBM77_12920 [Spirochaetaceae bacterium]|nr:hypothetical protein [Spirochaetaceae bacterium]
MLTACPPPGDTGPNVKDPPATVASGAEAQAYFEEIWGDIPSDWKEGILEEWSALSEGNGGPAITSLDDIPEQMWTMFANSWDNVSDVIDKINAGDSFADYKEEQNAPSGPDLGDPSGEPLADPIEIPDTIADGAAAKAYFEEIWSKVPSDWQTGILALWSGLAQQQGGNPITSLDNVPEQMWEMFASSTEMMAMFINAINEGYKFDDIDFNDLIGGGGQGDGGSGDGDGGSGDGDGGSDGFDAALNGSWTCIGMVTAGQVYENAMYNSYLSITFEGTSITWGGSLGSAYNAYASAGTWKASDGEIGYTVSGYYTKIYDYEINNDGKLIVTISGSGYVLSKT